jgi:hypothetical protein
MNRRTFLSRVLPIMTVLSVISASCAPIDWGSLPQRIIDEGKEYQTGGLEESFAINSKNILGDLQKGKIDAFTQLPKGVLPTYSNARVEWKQSDFLYIAQALHEHVWNDTLDGWQIEYMRFNLKCVDISSSFQKLYITFFKSQESSKGSSRLTRTFYIQGDENLIEIDEVEYKPEIYKWLSIDMANVKIPVGEALQIAEQNGGEQFRKETGNNCYINAVIDQHENEKWLISYSSGSEDQEKSFKVEINTLTGDYNKVH